MNAAATQVKENLMTRIRACGTKADDAIVILTKELAKLQSRKAPVQAAALERHDASIAGYKAAIAELAAPANEEEQNEPAGTMVAVFTAEGFAGVVSADSDVSAMAAEAEIKVTRIIKGCSLCASKYQVPSGAAIVYVAEWNEDVYDNAGNSGKIVYKA